MENNHAKLVCINIVSINPSRLADFYRNILGAEINDTHGGPNRIEIWFGQQNDNSVCIAANYDADFVQQSANACQGFELRVLNADAEYKRIQRLDVEIKEPPKDLPWGYRYFNIKDPDGNGIDIVQKL